MPPHDDYLERFVRQNKELIVVLTPEGILEWMSEGWQTFMGWDPDELIGTSALDLCHPEDLESHRKNLEIIALEGSLTGIESRAQRSDGNWRWLLWNATFDREIGLFFASARDIHAIQTTNRILESRQRLLAMIEHVASIGYWKIDIETEEVMWSDEVFRIHGLPISGQAPTIEECFAAYHPDDRAGVTDTLSRSMCHGHPFEFEHRIIRTDKSTRFVRVRGRHEDDPDGAFVIGIIQDITSEHLLRQRAAQLERLDSLGTLAAGISHEINNPLAYIEGNLELLADMIHEGDAQDPEEVSEILADVRDGVHRIGKIVKGLKAFTRSDGSDAILEQITATQIIQDAITLTGHELRRHAEVRVSLPTPDLYTIQGNSTQLTQVLVNLLLNAGQSIPDGQDPKANHIDVRARVEGDFMVISIEDTGEGIPEHLQTQIFAPYTTTKAARGGTGLGLALSQQIAATHAGILQLARSSPEGSVFQLMLPITPPAGLSDLSSSSVALEELELPSPILIIEDKHKLGKTIGRLLGDEVEFEICESASEALSKLARGEHFELILCELIMPQMNGVAFHRALDDMGLLDSIDLVFMAGAIPRGELRDFLDRMNHPVLFKPFSAERLRQVLLGVEIGDSLSSPSEVFE